MPGRADRPTSDDFMLRGITLGQLGNTIGNRVHGMLEDLYGELLAEASRVDPDKPPSWKHARLEVLRRKVDALIKGTYGTILRDVTSDMTTLAGSESEWVRSLVNKAAGDELMDVALHQRDLKVLATDTMIQGAPSAQWWGQQASATEDAFMREIRNGVLRGESIDDMARRVRGKPTGKRFSWYTKKGEHRWNVEFEGGLLQTNTRNAKALVRTSVQAVAGQARRETYLANRDVVKGIEQVSTLDTRTTPICMAYDGEQWYFEDQDNEESLTQAAREAHSPGLTTTYGAGPQKGKAQEKKREFRPLSKRDALEANDAWASELTEEQLIPIDDYVGGTFKDINTFLRTDEKKTSGHTKESLREWRDKLDQLIAETPGMPEDASVFRAGSPKMLGAKSAKDIAGFRKMIGKKVSDKAYVSTSIFKEVASGDPDHAVCYRIQVPKGTKGIFMPSVGPRQKEIMGYTSFEMALEGEFLLGRNGQFIVSAVEETNRGTVVVLDYIGGGS